MRRSLASTASVALSLVAGLAAALALADIYVNEGEVIGREFMVSAKSEVAGERSWESQVLWEESHHFLQLAKVLDPLNPDIYEDLGALSELKVPEKGSLDADALAALDRALEYYRRSVALRPAWPYGWIDVALLKLRQGQLDGEFALAMERATTLGPWETGVQYRIAAGALKKLDDLPVNIQDTVRLTVERGLQLGSEPFAELAEQYGFFRAGEGSR